MGELRTERMTVSQALAERNLERKKMEQRNNSGIPTIYCIANKATESRIQGVDKKKFIDNMKSDYQSVTDHLRRLNGLETAIARYNAEQDVEIAGRTYRVSEAIALKQYGMTYYKEMLQNMRSQYLLERNKADTYNKSLEDKSAKYMADNFGSKEKGTDDYEGERQKYIKNNEYEVVDPLDIKAKIDELEKFINDFETNVNVVLSIANSTTEIDIIY